MKNNISKSKNEKIVFFAHWKYDKVFIFLRKKSNSFSIFRTNSNKMLKILTQSQILVSFKEQGMLRFREIFGFSEISPTSRKAQTPSNFFNLDKQIFIGKLWIPRIWSDLEWFSGMDLNEFGRISDFLINQNFEIESCIIIAKSYFTIL